MYLRCGLCLKVCPFADHEDDEDTIGKYLYGDIPGIDHHPEDGYYQRLPTSASHLPVILRDYFPSLSLTLQRV